MVTMTELISEPTVDPDAQAVITDFLDFTEYLPSDLLRSLTLIRGLDETYRANSNAVHDLTKSYGSLPKCPTATRPDAQTLRAQISIHLDQAITARESSYAEAARLFDAADRHHNRLKSIFTKLNALPKPPSRDPTPQPSKSPDIKRSRSGRKVENGTSIQRLTLNPPRGTTVAAAILHRPRGHGRRVTVPGDVLPPYDPDSPIASTEVSDWESDPPTPVVRPMLKLKTQAPKEKESKIREPRETASYRKPTPPPEDAELGSKFKPWTRLTDWEMYKLRKKMKKNHNWEPSDIMIRRELNERGRGWDNYYRAKAEAQAKGRKFLDIDNLDRSQSKSEKVETPVPAKSVGEKKDAKKSEPKKQKGDPPVRTQAQLAAQEAEQAARRLGDIGSAFKNLFSPFSSALASLNRNHSSPTANGASAGKKANDKTQKKRRVDDFEASASPTLEEQKKKKQKTAPKPSPVPTTEQPITSTTTIKIPLKLNIVPQSTLASNVSTPLSTSRAPSARRASIPPKMEFSPPVQSRPSSRRSTVEPVIASGGRTSRRTSTPMTRKTPAPETTPKTAASRRSRREAPGTVMQSSQDGGAAVSVSKRKTKPGKKAVATPKVTETLAPQIRVDVDGKQELVDPDEERYCVCGDVSWGEMICCELDEKCDYGQWFHMECVSLAELPPRTVKWYCPGDRKILKKGENTNGLVGRSIK